MPREHATPARNRVGSLAASLLIVGALYLGKSLFLPFAVALLLAFLLAPVVHALEHLRLGRVPAVLVTLVLAGSAVAGLAWLVYEQVDQLADRLPSYRENVRRKITAVRAVGPLKKIQESLADLMPAPDEPWRANVPEERTAGSGEAVDPPRGGPTPEPVTVRVVPAPPTPIEFLERGLRPLLAPLGAAGVVFVLLLFVLVYQEDLRDRLVRLVSRRELVRTTHAIADVSQRISRYLVLTLIVNVTYGVPIGLALWLLGIPNAVLWGVLATVLRFIPYIGPWIAAIFPIFLSIAISPGWGLTFAVVALFVTAELISNNVVEPWLYGRRTGLAPVAVIVAAIFWTWLWGTPGLLLSIPLTLVLAVLGRHVPQLKFLNIMLRDEPGLRPDERYYQRLVAGDPEEAAEVAEGHASANGRTKTYDDVIIPAIRASRDDALDGRLDAGTAAFVRDSTRMVVEVLADRDMGTQPPSARHDGADAQAELQSGSSSEATSPGRRVLLVSAGDDTDTLTMTMLAEALHGAQLDVKVLSGAVLASEAVAAVKHDRPDVVLVGGIPPYVVLRARHLVRRLRVARPEARLLLGLWSERPGVEGLGSTSEGVDRITTSIVDAAAAIRTLSAEVGRSGQACEGQPA